MDFKPVDRNVPDQSFHAPLSPLSKDYSSLSRREIGQKLFDTALDFYAWYLSWVRDPGLHSSTFKVLSQIMRIAQVSLSGGKYLSEEDEISALAKLSQLKEKLFDGNLKPENILSKLLDILQNAIHTNPKARLVAYVTEVEYVFYLDSKERRSSEFIESLQKQVGLVMGCISPTFPDLHAHAIAQGLAQLLENPKAVQNPHHALNEAVGHWLDY